MTSGQLPAARATVEDWIAGLDDVGYVVVPSVLDEGDVEALRAAFPPASSGSTLHVEIGDETPHVERWLALRDHPRIARLLADTLGEFDVRVHGRDPGLGGGAQGLHADRPPGRVHDIDSLTLMWMLDELTRENGATRLVPRSHRGAAAVPRALAQPEARHPDEVVILGRPGDVLIFDAHLWHSGRRNRDGARRRVVQMTATRTSLTTGPFATDAEVRAP